MFGNILNPSWTDQERYSRHTRDLNTLWFSIDRKDNGSLEFEEFPRFSQLLFEHRQEYGTSSSYYPRLVSFIGDAGAGKSTLIRMLMERPWKYRERQRDDQRNVDVPVVGRHDCTIPTSGDVHLYRDPFADQADISRPLLYADCEGFYGGEKVSDSLLARRDANSLPSSSDILGQDIGTLAKISYAYLKNGVKRALRMPTRVTDQTRESAVMELFPRLLYNFSDVIIHLIPQQAARTLEGDIIRLFDWAKTSGESAINRATLPQYVKLNKNPLTFILRVT
jgi:hypothetical protein